MTKKKKPDTPKEATNRARVQKRQERRRLVNEDLQMELTALRFTLNDIIERYKLKLDADLLQLSNAASGNVTLGESVTKLSVSVAEAMLKEIRALEIKPQKGRAKDLQRVQDLVADLIEKLPAEK